jgi:hypothetical protein
MQNTSSLNELKYPEAGNVGEGKKREQGSRRRPSPESSNRSVGRLTQQKARHDLLSRRQGYLAGRHAPINSGPSDHGSKLFHGLAARERNVQLETEAGGGPTRFGISGRGFRLPRPSLGPRFIGKITAEATGSQIDALMESDRVICYFIF